VAMGIKGLMNFLKDNAPKSVKEVTFDQMTNRVLAIDASMNLYQFIIAIRDNQGGTLQNEAGDVTSHINGFLARTIKILEAGAKPVYVFDGKAPELKQHTLDDRREAKQQAEADLKEAQEKGDNETVKKIMGRTVRVTKKHNEDVQELMRLMGCPVVMAPAEAEAQCAELCKGGKVYAAATEDLDTLTFGSNKLVRNLFSPEAQKKPIFEVDLALALEQLGVTMDQFIDFCILCGCDYIDSIKGLGPQTGIKLIIEHKTIEEVLPNSETARKAAPNEEWLERLKRVRDCFKNHDVTPASEVDCELKEPDYEGLRKFLVDTHQFNADRVDKQLARLRAARAKKTQARLDQFFTLTRPEIKDSDKFDPKAKKKASAKAKPGAKKAIAKKK
jgi:flap endonuclease-1